MSNAWYRGKSSIYNVIILKLNCGVKFILRMNGNILVIRCILRRLQIIGTKNL
jgi:hypothetical protein